MPALRACLLIQILCLKFYLQTLCKPTSTLYFVSSGSYLGVDSNCTMFLFWLPWTFPAPSNLNESSPPKSRTQLSPYSPKLVQSRLKEVLSKHSNGFWVSKLPQLYRELYKEELPSEALKDLEQWIHICTVSSAIAWPNILSVYKE